MGWVEKNMTEYLRRMEFMRPCLISLFRVEEKIRSTISWHLQTTFQITNLFGEQKRRMTV